ncbi:MAG: hypothetical protein ACRDVC_00610 [Acidimicrobiales bacterium]
MSDSLGLGDSDAESRWIGVRRHQGALVIVGLGLVSAWVMGASARPGELVVGLVALVCAVPTSGGQTLGEALAVVVRYLARSKWSAVAIREFGDDVVIWAPNDVVFRAYELEHRGRLDLSGRDVSLALALAALVDAASASSDRQHVSQHVIRRDRGTSTLLALPPQLPAPDGWRHKPSLAMEAARAGEDSSLHLYERLTYLRTPDLLLRVFRVRDFSSVPESRSVLEQLLRSPVGLDVSVHVDVVAGAKAQRLAARAVHRVRSDDVTSSAAGFRRTARTSRGFERLAQREVLVASGRALVRLAVYVVVSGASLEVLSQRSDLVWRRAHDGGLRLDRGRGRQYEWFRAQLPGGPGW